FIAVIVTSVALLGAASAEGRSHAPRGLRSPMCGHDRRAEGERTSRRNVGPDACPTRTLQAKPCAQVVAGMAVRRRIVVRPSTGGACDTGCKPRGFPALGARSARRAGCIAA